MASRAGHYEVAEFLLQNRAPVDAKAKVEMPNNPHIRRQLILLALSHIVVTAVDSYLKACICMDFNGIDAH